MLVTRNCDINIIVVVAMFLIKAAFCFYSLIYLISTKVVVNKSNNMEFLQNCVENIVEKYLEPSDFIVFLNLNDKFRDIILNS